MSQDIWRNPNEGYHHRLMETKLSEKHFKKERFSRMNVSLATQVYFFYCINDGGTYQKFQYIKRFEIETMEK